MTDKGKRLVMIGAALAAATLGQAARSAEPFALAPDARSPIYADETASNPQPSAVPQLPADSPRPLMGLLGQTPIGKGLHDARINIYGWIEGSYEYNFQVRDGTANSTRSFDFFENNKGYLNQLDLSVEKKVDLTAHQFDIGGRLDAMYGSDARFITSSGLFDRQAPFAQEAWFDLPQVYVDLALPIANGVRLRVGKFEFFKTTDPNASAFYTHPIEYASSFPYTLTGISGYYPITPELSVEAGISRGWDQSLRDNNGAIDAFGRVTWNVTDRSRFIAAFIVGPEQFHDNSHYTTAVDISYAFAASDQLIFLIDGIYGHQARADLGGFPGQNTAPSASTVFDAANWYGVNGFVTYKVSDALSVSGRLEWYRDEEGYTLGFGGGNINAYEATVGLKIAPFATTALGTNFVIRPEVRYDYTSKDYIHPSSTSGFGTRHDQLTVAIDAIFNF